MEWYANEWCISVSDLIRDDRSEHDQSELLAPIVSRYNYDALQKRSKLKVVRQGKGKGNYALVSYASLPNEIKQRVRQKYPTEVATMKTKTPTSELYRSAYSVDYDAKVYYLKRLRELNLSLSDERLIALADEYTTNASVIQAVLKLRADNDLYRKVRGRRGCSWADLGDAIKFYQREHGHTLGASPTRFSARAKQYLAEGYEALVSKKFGNDNTRKVSVETERLLLALAGDKHRPYHRTVWQWYCDFLAGATEFIDPATGEVYDPRKYPDLSEKTVGDILGKAVNQAVLSKRHDARHDYRTTLRPYVSREKPRYSLSMVSMDDKDFGVNVSWIKEVKKLIRGREVVKKMRITTALKAYICYDVASEAIIGYAFSGEKTRDIFEGCVKSMYRNLIAWGLGQPYEAQVENHLVSLYKEGMMKDNVLFPVVTFAGAENSQEKYAERYNEVLKYQFEKYLIDQPIGRPHARLMSNRTKNRKANDEANNNYVQNEYSFDEACRAYERVIEAYNNSLHPKQKMYPGKTRLEVLKTCQHEKVQPIDLGQLARWAGERVDTSIVRGQFQANHEKYSVSPELLDRLGRDARVSAYWWEQTEGEPAELVYLYHDGVYLGECPRIVPFQVSKLERTASDMRLMQAQAGRVARWDKAVAERASEGVIRLSAQAVEAIELAPVRTVAMPLGGSLEEDDEEDWISRTRDYARLGIDNL